MNMKCTLPVAVVIGLMLQTLSFTGVSAQTTNQADGVSIDQEVVLSAGEENTSVYAIEGNAQGQDSIVIGEGTYTGENATGSIAIGSYYDSIYGKVYTHIGFGVQRSIAIGAGAYTDLSDTVVIGTFAHTSGSAATNAVVIGTKAIVDGSNSIAPSTGRGDAQYRQIQYVAAGEVSSTSTDAINGSQIQAVIDAVEGNQVLIKKNEETIGNLNTKVESNTNNIGSLQSDMAGIQESIGDLRNDIAGVSGNIDGFQNDIAGIKENIGSLQEDMTGVKDGIANLQGDIAGVKDDIGSLKDEIGDLNTKVEDNVGVGAAALASLHPLDYDANNKFTMSASVGNYRGTQATAFGAFYRPNENVMLSLAGSVGSGENLASLGVSFAIGKGVGPYRSQNDMTQTIETLQAENRSLKDKMNEQEQKLAELMRKVDALMAQK